MPAPSEQIKTASTPLADAARRLRGRPGRPRLHPAPAPRPRHVPDTSPPQTRMDGWLQGRPSAGEACALPTLVPRLLGLKAAASYLSCSTWLIRRLVEEGALHRIQLAGSRRLLLDRLEMDELVVACRA
jgi:hypothetical protein